MFPTLEEREEIAIESFLEDLIWTDSVEVQKTSPDGIAPNIRCYEIKTTKANALDSKVALDDQKIQSQNDQYIDLLPWIYLQFPLGLNETKALESFLENQSTNKHSGIFQQDLSEDDEEDKLSFLNSYDIKIPCLLTGTEKENLLGDFDLPTKLSEIENTPLDVLLRQLDKLEQRIYTPSSDLSQISTGQQEKALLFFRHTLNVYNIGADDAIKIKQVNDIYSAVTFFCSRLQNRLELQKKPPESLITKCRTVSQAYHDAYNVIMIQRKCFRHKQFSEEFKDVLIDSATTEPNKCELGLELLLPSKYKKENNDEINEIQYLVLYFLRLAESKGYIKNGDEVRAPVFYDKQHTFTYKSVMTISDFVAEAIKDYEKDTETWKICMMKNHREKVIAELKATHSPQFPTRQKERTLFSFPEGIYSTQYKQFFHWSMVNALPFKSKGIAVAKFHKDQHFRNEMYELILELADRDWYALPTPILFTIWDAQGYSEEVKRFLCMCIGRMFQKFGTDNWQFILWCIGKAGTGKSTLAKIFEYIFEEGDCGSLSQIIEKQFGLHNFFEPNVKFVVTASDVSKGIGLPLPILLNWISAEAVQIPRKGRIAIHRKMDIPFLMCSNILALKDTDNALARRVAFLHHNLTVKNLKTYLLEYIVKYELAIIIKKCTEAYWTCLIDHGHENIWDFIPKYFKEKREEISSESNSIRAFLRSNRVLLISDYDRNSQEEMLRHFDPRYITPLEKLEAQYNEYCTHQQLKSDSCIAWNEQNYKPALESLGCFVFPYNGLWPWNGTMQGQPPTNVYDEPFVYGCCLAADFKTYYQAYAQQRQEAALHDHPAAFRSQEMDEKLSAGINGTDQVYDIEDIDEGKEARKKKRKARDGVFAQDPPSKRLHRAPRRRGGKRKRVPTSASSQTDPT